MSQNGILPDHEVKCPWCYEFASSCEKCSDQKEPCEECLSECPCCEGTRIFRWPSFYAEDITFCDECGREVPVMNLENDTQTGTWVCFDCLVVDHSLACPDCTKWKQWETIEQLLNMIEGKKELRWLETAQTSEQFEYLISQILLVKKLKNWPNKDPILLQRIEEIIQNSDSEDLVLSTYFYCLSEESKKRVMELNHIRERLKKFL